MKRRFLKAALAAMGLAVVMPAIAQSAYPNRPVRLIVPFPAGGIVDIIGRELADRLTSSLGQPVLVENRVGAGGAIGTDIVAKAPPDGLTLVLATPGHTILPATKKVPFDPVRDFAPVAMIAEVPQVVAVPASMKATSLKQYTEAAKSMPGKLSYGSSGNGSLLHLMGEQYKQLADVNITHVPYKGQPAALTDLIEGRISMMPLSLGVGAPHIKSGRLRGLAVTSTKRSPLLPDVPSVVEAGMPEFTGSAWFALLAPAKTPQPILNRLASEVEKIAAQPEFVRKLQAAGGEINFMGPEKTADFIKNEVLKWQRVVDTAGIK